MELAHMGTESASQTASQSCFGMMGMMGNLGAGWGWFWLITGVIFWLAILATLILFIIWLVKQIQK